MRNRFWLLRNNYPKKHATSNRNINAYDRGLYLQVEIVFGKNNLNYQRLKVFKALILLLQTTNKI